MIKDKNLERLKQNSEFIRDVMKPVEDIFDNIEQGIKDYVDPNSEFNRINRGEEI